MFLYPLLFTTMSSGRIELEYIPETGRYSLRTRATVWVIKWWLRIRRLLERLSVMGPLNVRDISWAIEKVVERRKNLRQILCDQLAKVHLLPVSRSHTHRRAAQLRTSVNQFMNDAARRAGFTPYNVSKSGHDYEGGSRYFYMQKDLSTGYTDDAVTDNTAFIFCDVDYYCDMARWMMHFKPIIIYTLVPETVCHRGPDYSFFIKDNEVVYSVSGGGKYQHRLWDYSGDTMSVVDPSGALCVFNVEQKKLDDDPNRRIVWLVPMARIPGPIWAWVFEAGTISRKTITHDNISMVYESITDRMSVARNGAQHSVELLGKTYAAIQKRLAHKQSPPVVADIERLLLASGSKTAPVDAPILYELVAETDFVPNVVLTTAVEAHFQPLGSLHTEDGPQTGRVVGNSLLSEPSVYPNRGVCADEATVAGRIHKVRNNIVPTKQYKVWAKEFVEFLVPEPGKGSPLTPGQVRQLQNTPQQAARYNQVEHLLSCFAGNRLEAFIKAEPYANVSDPRNITTMSPELTVMMSCFTYAFKEQCLKKQSWYGPGKTPKQIARRLQQLAQRATRMVSTDFSRFDGTISEFLQKNIVQASYLRWVAPEYRAELAGWFKEVFRQVGKTANGIKFEPGFGTRSGSPITTDGNTEINAFVMYCALRLVGHCPEEAWRLLGLAYGDDGSMPDLDGKVAQALEQAARDLGLVLKSEVIENGEPLPFLGRFFVDPLTRLDSFQDPMRTIGKLHTTTNKGVSQEQALFNKAAGYETTDSMTPIIGSWVRNVKNTYPHLKFKGALKEEQHKRSNAWVQQDPVAIRDAMAKVIGILPSELDELDRLVQNTALDRLPVLLESRREFKIPAVLGDVVVGPGPLLQPDSQDANIRPTLRSRERSPLPPTPEAEPSRRRERNRDPLSPRDTGPRGPPRRSQAPRSGGLPLSRSARGVLIRGPRGGRVRNEPATPTVSTGGSGLTPTAHTSSSSVRTDAP